MVDDNGGSEPNAAVEDDAGGGRDQETPTSNSPEAASGRLNDGLFADSGENHCGSWLVLACACVLGACVLSIPSSFSLLFRRPIAKTEAADDHSVLIYSAVYNAGEALFYLTASFIKPLVAIFGHRLLVAGIFMTGSGLVASSLVANLLAYFATYSLLVGGGCGILYHATRLKLRHTFFLKRRVANCIFQSCSVLGKAALPAGVALLAEQFAFKDVLRIVAGITFTTVILGIVSTSDVVKSKRLLRMQMRPRIARGQNDEPISRAVTITGAGKRCWADCEAALVLVCVADGLLVAAMGNLLWALPIYADERGWGARVGAVLLVALHAAELVGRPLVTLLLDLKCWDSRFMYGVLFVVAAGLNTGIALNPSFETTIAICALLGLTKSGLTQFINGILAQRYLDDKVTFRKYLKAFFRSIFFCCATVIGLFVQHFKTSSVAFYILSGMHFGSALIAFVVLLLVRRI